MRAHTHVGIYILHYHDQPQFTIHDQYIRNKKIYFFFQQHTNQLWTKPPKCHIFFDNLSIRNINNTGKSEYLVILRGSPTQHMRLTLDLTLPMLFENLCVQPHPLAAEFRFRGGASRKIVGKSLFLSCSGIVIIVIAIIICGKGKALFLLIYDSHQIAMI